MLYFLSALNEVFGPLRLFEYVTFRAGSAALTAFLIVALCGAKFAAWLKSKNAQSAERLAGLVPAEFIDKEKNKTPCMGGLLLIPAILISSVFWVRLDTPISLALLTATFSFSALGFYDDYRKVVYKDRNGLPGRYKLLGQVIIAALAIWEMSLDGDFYNYLQQVWVPFCKDPVYAGFLSYVIALLTIVGASNAVNLTDGKDGLASGCTIFCSLTYAVFAYLIGHRVFAGYLNIPFLPTAGEAVVFGFAICGACIGFLWHNCHPASMFMGDTGSLALGGGVGLLAVLTRQEILLLLVGSVFVMEAVSDILQVASFKLTGKRIFLCAPIHHHFERKGWTETQIVVRFWIIAGISSLLALATLKLR